MFLIKVFSLFYSPVNVCTVHFSPLTQAQFQHFEQQLLQQKLQHKLEQTKPPSTPRRLTRGTTGNLPLAHSAHVSNEPTSPVATNVAINSPQRPIAAPENLKAEISSFDWFRFREKRTSQAINNQPKVEITQSSPQLTQR